MDFTKMTEHGYNLNKSTPPNQDLWNKIESMPQWIENAE